MDFELYDLEINQYLYAIESIIDSYEPVSDYLDIFEADNPEVQKQVAENNQQVEPFVIVLFLYYYRKIVYDWYWSAYREKFKI